jgi:hypothetical protein
MPARIVSNDLPDEMREPIAQAVLDAIGKHDGDWAAKIQNVSGKDAWDVRIDGPDDFEWTHRFSGAERDATIIRNSVRASIEMAVGGLAIALSELAMKGISFTTEPRADGGMDYIIDRVTLRDDEVTQLAHKGALTLDGIRNYLINR